MLLDRFYITKRRVWTHIILWIIFSTLSGVVLFLLPSGIMQKISLFALAVWLVVFGVVLARRVIIAYRRAIRIFNETQADDIGAYIKWLSIFTYWALISIIELLVLEKESLNSPFLLILLQQVQIYVFLLGFRLL